MLSDVSRDWEGSIVRVSQVIIRISGVYYSRGRRSGQRRRGGQSSSERRWNGSSEGRRSRQGHRGMFQPFEVAVSFCLGKREEDSTKGGVNNFGGKHGNEDAKTVKM